MEVLSIPLSSIKLKEEVELNDEQKEVVHLLAESFKQNGQLHPIIVLPDDADGMYSLGVGRKRLLAAREAEMTHISAVVTTDPLKIEEITLHENLRRSHLEWWERAALIKAFHDNQMAQKDTRDNKAAKGKIGEKVWGVRDTAKELGLSMGAVSEDLNLANYVALDPRLKNVTDRRTAIMLINQEKKRMDAEEEGLAPDLALARTGAEPTLNEAYFGDSFELLKSFPDGYFDACVTDPPWLRFRGIKELEADERTHHVFREVYRVLKVNSFLYMFAGLDDVIFYRDFLMTLGFKVSKTPCLWIKENSLTAIGVAAWEYGRNYEFILVAVKGTPVLAHKVQKSATFKYRVVHGRTAIHPNEKPVDLLEEILEDCSYEGNKVLDPFGGSGALGEAAWKKRRSFLVIERDRSSYEQIVTRYKEMRKEEKK